MTEQPVAPVQPVVPTGVAQPTDHRSAEVYVHQTPYGTLTLPKMKRAMNMGFVRKNRNLSETEMIFILLEKHLDEAQLATFDQLDSEEFGELMDSWRKDSGISLGESEGS